MNASSGVFIDISWAEFSEVTFVAGSAVSVLTLPESTDEPVDDRLITGKVTSDVRASGGDRVYTISLEGNLWRVHEFRTVGESQFVVPDGETLAVEYLVVGGGGGGGIGTSNNWGGGGGGAGGLLEGGKTVSSGNHQVVVGAGGVASQNIGGDSLQTLPPGKGGNSSVFSIVGIGGGAGVGRGGGWASIPWVSGGSGGGGGITAQYGRGLGTPGQGFDGGFVDAVNRGGGGGAGGPGEDNFSGSPPNGNGGPGVISGITGALTLYAEGGGGTTVRSVKPLSQGNGSGGSARTGQQSIEFFSQPGNPGIVIVRYQL